MDANVLGVPFRNIAPLAAVNDATYDDDDPSPTGDLLEPYVDSDRPGAGAAMGDIWSPGAEAPPIHSAHRRW